MRNWQPFALIVTMTVVHSGCAGPAPMPSSAFDQPAVLTDFPAGPPDSEPAPIPSMVATPEQRYDQPVDVMAYELEIAVSDSAAWVQGRARIDVRITGALDGPLELNFTGLAIDAVAVNGEVVDVSHEAGRLGVPVSSGIDRALVEVLYRGVPDDGLIVGRNVHDRPTAFADNWSSRARFWFPGVDHPSDKATVSYTIHAPRQWEVIANGALVGEPEPTPEGTFGPSTTDGRRTWRWDQDVPISTYNMVFGGGEMAIDVVGLAACGRAPASRRTDGCVEVTTWLFPESRDVGRASFARAAEMVDHFTETIGPFPYAKLANVQSTTRFGGMENASAIFYSDDQIASGRLGEGVVSHEIAHQWFGDAVTQADWHHLWLSEGFATYFGAQFFETADGVANFRERMERHRIRYLSSDVVGVPIVDANKNRLIDAANHYQKGGWVLHMLRGVIGDDAFFDGIRGYYRRFENSTALTDDLQAVMEEVTGWGLGWFFDQWVRKPGYPLLSLEHSYDAAAGEVVITVRQEQDEAWPTFRLPMAIEVSTEGGVTLSNVEMTDREQTFRVPASHAPTAVIMDPDGWVLKRLVGETLGG